MSKHRCDRTISAEYVRSVLEYDSLTGIFIWKVDICRGPRKHSTAGYIHPQGYYRVRLNGVTYLAHRIAWLHFYGEWPDGVIDHIDGNKANNQISNLRSVTQSVNAQNKRKASTRNKSGFLGVSVHRNKFRSGIKASGKHISIGVFQSAEAAHEAYVNAKRELHEGCSI